MINPETILKTDEVVIGADPHTGCVISFRLYGRELLDAVNGKPHIRVYPPSSLSELKI